MPYRQTPSPAQLVAALALLASLAACSSTSTLRLCNGRLEPINPPERLLPAGARTP
jgi:uncharacterized lipoprotein